MIGDLQTATDLIVKPSIPLICTLAWLPARPTTESVINGRARPTCRCLYLADPGYGKHDRASYGSRIPERVDAEWLGMVLALAVFKGRLLRALYEGPPAAPGTIPDLWPGWRLRLRGCS